MSRRRKLLPLPDGCTRTLVALVLCTDAFHNDERGFAEHGHHIVGKLYLVRDANGRPVRLEWTGPRAETRNTVRTSGITLSLPGIAPDLPVKARHRGDGGAVWRFRCSCGRDPQPSEADLAGIAARWVAVFPGRPIELDLVRLR